MCIVFSRLSEVGGRGRGEGEEEGGGGGWGYGFLGRVIREKV